MTNKYLEKIAEMEKEAILGAGIRNVGKAISNKPARNSFFTRGQVAKVKGGTKYNPKPKPKPEPKSRSFFDKPEPKSFF